VRDPDAFARGFADYWAAPSADGLAALLADDVRLVQPMSRPAIGIEGAKRWFAGVAAAIPDIHAEVDRWSATGEYLFIDFRLIGTVGGRRVEWPAVDRFVLGDDNRATERVSYFDPTPLLLAGLRSPRGWIQLVRALF
jgi:SnoaL-like domain